MLKYNEKPDISGFQQFGCEGWLHQRVDQRPDSKFDARGEPVIFVGYTPNQKGFLLWCPERGLNSVVVSNNVVFGHNCPRSKCSAIELLNESASDDELSTMLAALTLQEGHTTCDLHIVGTFEGNFILSDSHLEGL
jgi:hypothetical protein